MTFLIDVAWVVFEHFMTRVSNFLYHDSFKYFTGPMKIECDCIERPP